MPLESPTIRRVETPGFEGLEIIDSDVHNSGGPKLREHLPSRWTRYLDLAGRRNVHHTGATSAQRPGACRLDAFPPGGGLPGTDPDFAAEQLLDEYGISAGILNTLDWLGGGNVPVELEIAIARATNDYNLAEWLEHDPRWRASIMIAPEHPEAAAAEIERCCAMSDAFVQVIIGSRTERPQGNPKYWPIYEAAAAHGLPVAFHVGTAKYHGWSAVGEVTYYYEMHVGFPMPAQTMAASMIFEGVFERFPTLKVVATELGWEWAAPLSWRMDRTHSVLRDEVAHLTRRPSEYFQDHFWFSTQPCVEPERPEQFDQVYEQFVEAGFGGHLLFATDYPHWDMDSPFEATPPSLSRDDKRLILAESAAALYGIALTGGGEA